MNTKEYWKTLEELPQTGEFLVPPAEDKPSEIDRREFLRLMGASLAMASAAGCMRRPVEKIIPYLNTPEEITLGVANWYASTCGECPAACGILAKTREGRPIKLEGNPDHPMNRGGLCARGQASLLNLYDPDRLKGPLRRSRQTAGGQASLACPEPCRRVNRDSWEALSWDEVDRSFETIFKNIQPKKEKVRLLTGHIVSPATRQLISEFLSRFEDAKHIVFEPLSLEELTKAQAACYGEAVIPRYRFDKAKLVVSFGADFLDTWLSPVEFTRQFSKNRKLKDGKMSRFVCFESYPTVTGSNADFHIPVRPGDELKIAMSLAHELSGEFPSYSIDKVAQETLIDVGLLREVADSLSQHRGESLVLGGGFASQGPSAKALHVVVNFLNSILNNDGVTLDAQNHFSKQMSGSYEAIQSLIQEMMEGKIDLLLLYKTNPAYVLPKSFGFEKALTQVPLVISFADRVDETGKLCHWILPDHHSLESWGDAEPQSGLFSLFQPTIAPLYDTRSVQDTLLRWSSVVSRQSSVVSRQSSVGNWHDYLKKYWEENIYKQFGMISSFATFWETSLRDGVFDSRKLTDRHSPRDFNMGALTKIKNSRLMTHDSQLTTHDSRLMTHDSQLMTHDSQLMTLVLYPTIPHYDGRHANNSWLMELPDPVTKITWRNYVCLSPAKAAELGLREGDVLKVKSTNHDPRTTNYEAELPLHIQPGLHSHVTTVPLGFGRTAAGRVPLSDTVNGFQFVSKEGGGTFTSPVTLEKTGKWVKLATTQGHHHIEGRPIIKETTLHEYQKNPKAGNEEALHLPSLWSGHKYEGHRWGMAIDMNACTGCSACMIACQAENNIPVVGEKEVQKGREMHWIRIDRYYSEKAENPDVTHQPMLCQHCENAPCETVCPVVATLHDSEGLNVQVYNRCVGTRYCSNNCPYKVRRFNWFEHLRGLGGPLAYVLNPDVTVREKGVMEKCTFCVQRIQEGKDHAKDLGKKLADGDIKTACQQSCPAEAIIFGDLNDPENRVSQLAKDPRGYKVLADLNTNPSIIYLTKVRNK